ncbi:hypothetical protein AOA61_28505, partial [Pseudomonas sp. 2995-1]
IGIGLFICNNLKFVNCISHGNTTSCVFKHFKIIILISECDYSILWDLVKFRYFFYSNSFMYSCFNYFNYVPWCPPGTLFDYFRMSIF